MGNKIDGAVDNLRLENQLTELTSLVRQLVVEQHQPNTTVRVYGICTSVEHPTDLCLALQEIESDDLESVGSTGEYQYGKQSYQSHIDRVRVKGNTQLRDSDPARTCLRVKATVSRIRDTNHHRSNSNNRECHHMATHHL
ncbi:hypothetical protein CR513_40759, partial [Mucuna pruriens]